MAQRLADHLDGNTAVLGGGGPGVAKGVGRHGERDGQSAGKPMEQAVVAPEGGLVFAVAAVEGGGTGATEDGQQVGTAGRNGRGVTAAELVAGGRQEFNGEGGAGLAAVVDQEALAELAFLQVGKVDKGHAAKEKLEAGQRLGLAEVGASGIVVKEPAELGTGKGFLLAGVYAGEDIAEKGGDVTGPSGGYTVVVDSAKHAEVGREGVGRRATGTEVVLVGFEEPAGDAGKGDGVAATEGAEGTEGVGVDMSGGVTAFAAQTLDVTLGTLGKGGLFHIGFSFFGVIKTNLIQKNIIFAIDLRHLQRNRAS
ncbi:hypothetical protein EVA_03681 [gut metagenome]|uniref:Uncharacterized protein n=1 Tax=gut metagenome TaxID=749906 RepID=J9GYF5_9ZZZZ